MIGRIMLPFLSDAIDEPIKVKNATMSDAANDAMAK